MLPPPAAPDPDVRTGCGSPLVGRARGIAEALLTGLDGGERWRHTCAVAARAGHVAALLEPHEAEALRAAAWLHDIGYAPALHEHGFHPVDGAHHVLRRLGHPQVAGLVAHHSGARFIAAERGLSGLLAPWTRPESWSGPLADALTWADQTTGPDGRAVTVDERLHEMLGRHGDDSPNARAHLRRGPVVIAAVRATEARLASAATALARALDPRLPVASCV